MKTILHPSDTRGQADYGWLQTRYTFSFANYYNKERLNFGALRVLNDDIIHANSGFGSHPHDNMEIITIPLAGQLKHKDSAGGGAVIGLNEVQVMSAGSGIWHSEENPSATESVELLQIWIYPEKKDIAPRWDQRLFDENWFVDNIYTVASPLTAGDKLWLNQNAFVSMLVVSGQRAYNYALHGEGNGVYIFVIAGRATVGGVELASRDGLGVWETDNVDVVATENSKLLFLEVPMRF